MASLKVREAMALLAKCSPEAELVSGFGLQLADDAGVLIDSPVEEILIRATQDRGQQVVLMRERDGLSGAHFDPELTEVS